jgi:hypothetical protein
VTGLRLADCPRLYVSGDAVADLKGRLHGPFLKSCAKRVLRDADWLVRAQPLQEGSAPTYQAVTRPISSHLQCLTTAWVLTRNARYRQAAFKHLANLLTFDQISCEANAATPAEPILPFCLSYGELSATAGLMYDLFRPELAAGEQKVFFAVLDKFLMRAAVKCLDDPPWWVGKGWSNWNGVCAGGMGIMALAFYDDLPDAPRLIPFVEKSLDPYFRSYIENGGGCPEGTGYWNYGMNYAMRYVLSSERATGRKHPALAIKELGRSLLFPLDFTGITFGDNDGWHPTAFYFLLARRLGLRHAALNAATHLPARVDPRGQRRGTFAESGDLLYAADAIPRAGEMERLKAAHRRRRVPVARVYRGMDWAVLADDEAFPTLRMAIRGGSARIAGHGFVDLLSFRCRVNGELMITDQADTGYLTTTFGKRGSDIYSRGPDSKSTLFVEGLGCAKDATCDGTERVKGKDIAGVRIDATKIYLPRMPAKFIGRLFLLVENAYWLVIDHVLSRDAVTLLGIESRFHTYAACRRAGNRVALKSGRERMQMTFASLQPGVMQESRGMPPRPAAQTRIFRWMGRDRVPDNLHVVALSPGSAEIGLKLRKEKRNSYVIEVSRPHRPTRRIGLTSELRLR